MAEKSIHDHVKLGNGDPPCRRLAFTPMICFRTMPASVPATTEDEQVRNKSGIFLTERSGTANPVTPDILDLIRHGDLLEVFDALIAGGLKLSYLKLNYGKQNKAQAMFVDRATNHWLELTFRPRAADGDTCLVNRYRPPKNYQLYGSHYATRQEIWISPEYIIAELGAPGFFLAVPRSASSEVKCVLEGFKPV